MAATGSATPSVPSEGPSKALLSLLLAPLGVLLLPGVAPSGTNRDLGSCRPCRPRKDRPSRLSSQELEAASVGGLSRFVIGGRTAVPRKPIELPPGCASHRPRHARLLRRRQRHDQGRWHRCDAASRAAPALQR